MKKILLLVILMAGVYQLKAQIVFPFKPADTLLVKKFSVKPSDSLTKLWTPLSKLNGLNAGQQNNLASLSIYHSPVDHMPIAWFSGNSKMPVINFQGNSKMPVLWFDNPKMPAIDTITRKRMDRYKPGVEKLDVN
jgi:hypothetical protein